MNPWSRSRGLGSENGRRQQCWVLAVLFLYLVAVDWGVFAL